MAADRDSNEAREVVGIFGDTDALQEAIDDLLNSGFDHADLSLLAGEQTVKEKLGHGYKDVAELEDDETAPRIHYISPESIGDAEGALVGGLAYIGAVGTIGLVAASGGALAALIVGAALGAGSWGLLGEALASIVEKRHAHYFQEQLQHGGLLLWVRCRNPEREKKASEILAKHSGRDVHAHSLPAS